ncbi:MAG: 50S ribosomal protein L2 [Candidatus Bathyarchaeota archaeon]|jgi:large subunit ribosomal protein L2
MGKRIRVQRRGRGGPTFRASTHKRTAPAKYPTLEVRDYSETLIEGTIVDLIHDPGRGTPLALVKFKTGKKCYTVVSEGVYKNQSIQMGGKASVEVGNILPVGKIPEGTMVCDLELNPGDGGRLARTSGTYASIVGHTPQGTMIRLPSGKTKFLNDQCRATIGIVAGGGRTEKPFLKAGTKFHLMKAKGHKYPTTRGRAMIVAAHPHGSSKRGSKKSRPVSRHAPPGQKVGLIAAKYTGKKKRRR